MQFTIQMRHFMYTMAKHDDLRRAAAAAEVSEDTAKEWLGRPEVAAEIQKDMLANLTTAMETSERIIARYAVLADLDVTEYYMGGDAGWAAKPIELLTHNQRRRIKKVAFTANGDMNIEFHDPVRALDKLAQIHGLFENELDTETAEQKARQIRDMIKAMEDATRITH